MLWLRFIQLGKPGLPGQNIYSNMTDNPNLPTPRSDDVYSNLSIDQLFSILKNSIGGKDFLILVIGEFFSGKTTYLSKFINESDNVIKSCQLKIKENSLSESNIQTYPAFLSTTENSQIILIDDAHKLKQQELSKIFRNVWDNTKKTNQVILFCEPGINKTIAPLLKEMPKNTSFNKLYIPNFDKDHTRLYLEHLCSTKKILNNFSFSEKDINKIFINSNGLPGKINQEAFKIYGNANVLTSKSQITASRVYPIAGIVVSILLIFLVAGSLIFKNSNRIPTINRQITSSNIPKSMILKSIDNSKTIDTEYKSIQNSDNEKLSLKLESDIIRSKEPAITTKIQPIIFSG